MPIEILAARGMRMTARENKRHSRCARDLTAANVTACGIGSAALAMTCRLSYELERRSSYERTVRAFWYVRLIQKEHGQTLYPS
jgi:hypothetical protein